MPAEARKTFLRRVVAEVRERRSFKDSVALAPETLVNCVAPGLLEGTRATSNLRPEQIERSASGSLLKKAADKDDCADMVVAMCRTETMTGQTVVIDSGRLFH